MNPKTILLIFRKEILDILRDRKALFFMVLLPIVAMPLLMIGIIRLGSSQAIKTRSMRLLVQAAPEDTERFAGLLRKQLQDINRVSEFFLKQVSPEIAAEVEEITSDLGISTIELMAGLAFDNEVLRHKKLDALREKLPNGLMDLRRTLNAGKSELGEGMLQQEALNADQREALMEWLDLATPLTTLEFVTAAETATIETDNQPSPTDELPDWIQQSPGALAAAESITARKIQAFLKLPENFGPGLPESAETAEVTILYDSTVPLSEEARRRLLAGVKRLNERLLRQRLADAGKPPSFVEPVATAVTNVAPPKKQALQIVSSFLPYLIILMCFFGGFYPAIDLGAGEKERYTLESLLVTPASRLEIASGKFLVVFLASLIAAVCATTSLALTFRSGLAPQELGSSLNIHIDATTGAMCMLLVLPTAATFASVLLTMSIYAKTFKEAQAFMAPVQFLVIVPAVISFIPDIELNYRLAWVPVLNVALGLREILGGGGVLPPVGQILVIVGSSAMVAAVAVMFCARWFNQEKVLFR